MSEEDRLEGLELEGRRLERWVESGENRLAHYDAIHLATGAYERVEVYRLGVPELNTFMLERLEDLQGVKHPYLTSVRHVWEHDGGVWVATDAPQSTPLVTYLRERGPMSPHQAQRLGLMLIETIKVLNAHTDKVTLVTSLGVPHIFISDSLDALSLVGWFKDVTVAAVRSASLVYDRSLQQADARYVTPELIKEQHTLQESMVREQTYQYLVALIMGEALSGSALASSSPADAMFMFHLMPKPLSDLLPLHPPHRLFFEHALAPEASERYPSLQAFEDALRQWIAEDDAVKRVEGRWVWGAGLLALSADMQESRDADRQPLDTQENLPTDLPQSLSSEMERGRRRTLLALMVLIVVVALGAWLTQGL